MSKISVIVPVYNVEAYLKRCVDSVLAQTYTDFELILVDDGSPDNCPAMCDEYAKKDSRIRVIHQENGGLSAARNAGIDWVFQNSNSEWFSFIDSDDCVHPKYLEVLLNAAENTNTSVAIGGYVEFSEDMPPIETVAEPQIRNTEDFFIEKNVNAIVAWGKLYRRKCFEEIRYPVGKLHEDEFTTYKILFQEEFISFIDTPLYFYYQNPKSITNQWNPKRLDVIDALYEQISFLQEKKLDMAYKWSCRHYFDVANSIVNLAKVSRKRKFIFGKQLRHAIKEFGENTRVSSNSHQHVWEIAYPERCFYYKARNVWRRIISKLHSV